MKRTRRKTKTNKAGGRRHGAVMIAAAICLLLATVFLASALKLATTGRRQVRREQFRIQADWLAEAGLERAAAQLETEAAYQGEIWEIAASEIGGRHTGQVVIQVKMSEDSEDSRNVIVEASYPVGTTMSAKRTRRSTIPVGNEQQK